MEAMDDQLTPEELIKAGKILEDSIINSMSIERRLEGIPEDELLKRIPDEKRIEGISEDELLKRIPDEKLLQRIPIQTIKAYLNRLDNEGSGKK